VRVGIGMGVEVAVRIGGSRRGSRSSRSWGEGSKSSSSSSVVKVHSSKGSNKISSGGGESGVKITTLQHL
jgi:hypothetical protein